jgi:MFS family permease
MKDFFREIAVERAMASPFAKLGALGKPQFASASAIPALTRLKMTPKQFSFDRDFAILFVAMLTTGAGNTALQSVMPTIGRSIKVPDWVIATIFSVSALIWVFAAPYWARRSDREGRRTMVIVGMAGFAVSILLVGMALFAGLQGWLGPLATMVAVISARVIYGTFGSASPPAAQAMVALKTSGEQRVKALTMLGSAFGLGTIIGPAIAPWLVVPLLGYAGPAFAFAVFGTVATLAAIIWLPRDGADESSLAKGANMSYPSIAGAPAGASATAANAAPVEAKLKLTDPRIWPWMLAGLIMGHAQAMSGSAMGFLVMDRLGLSAAHLATQESIGIVLMAGAGAALLVQWGLIPMLNLAPRAMMLVGLAIATLGLIMTSQATTLYGIATSYALSSMGFGFTRPSFVAGSSLAVSRRLQGLVAGRVTSVNGASFVLGPTLGVAMYEAWHALPFLISAVMLILMIPYALRRLRVVDVGGG